MLSVAVCLIYLLLTHSCNRSQQTLNSEHILVSFHYFIERNKYGDYVTIESTDKIKYNSLQIKWLLKVLLTNMQ